MQASSVNSLNRGSLNVFRPRVSTRLQVRQSFFVPPHITMVVSLGHGPILVCLEICIKGALPCVLDMTYLTMYYGVCQYCMWMMGNKL